MEKVIGEFDWAIIGDGPSGMIATGRLLDEGINPKRLAWIGPKFEVGDLGAKWSQVSSNTPAGKFVNVLRGYKSFGYADSGIRFALEDMDPQGPCKLQYVVEPMQWITQHLMEQVVPIRSMALGLSKEGSEWGVGLPHGKVLAKNVVLAMGSEPKRLNYRVPEIRLEDALDIEKLAKVFNPHDTVGVFGGSHSAIYVIHNLLELGAEQVVNFYRSPPRYAIDHGDWVEHNNNGLKQRAAAWAREFERNPPPNLRRVHATPENIERELPFLRKMVSCVGFAQRKIPIEGADSGQYDLQTGKVTDGVFGCGIGFPDEFTDRAGNVELNVGITKLDGYLRRVVPKVWLNGHN